MTDPKATPAASAPKTPAHAPAETKAPEPTKPTPEEIAAATAKAAEAEEKRQAEMLAAQKEPDGQLSAEQQKELDTLLGDDPEDDFLGEDQKASPAGVDPALAREELTEVFRVLRKLNKAIPETSPDSHTIWGAGGVVLNLGHLRTLIKYSPEVTD